MTDFMGKDTGIPLFADSCLLKEGTYPLGLWGHILVILDRSGESTFGGVVLFLAAKKEVFSNGPRLLVVGLNPSAIVIFVVVIIISVKVVLAVAAGVAVAKSLIEIASAVAVAVAVGGKGPLDLFQSGWNPAKTHGRFEFLQSSCSFDVILGGIDPGTIEMVGIGLFLLRAVVFFLFRALLNPVTLDAAKLARVPIWGKTELLGFFGTDIGHCCALLPSFVDFLCCARRIKIMIVIRQCSVTRFCVTFSFLMSGGKARKSCPFLLIVWPSIRAK